MKRKNAPLATAFALALAAGTFACAPAPDDGGTSPGTGGSSSGTGGSKGTGGTPAGTGGSASGTGGTAAGTGGTTAGTGGTSAGTGGTTAGTGGAAAGTGGTTGTSDAGGTPDSGPVGAFKITIDSTVHPTKPDRLCFKPEASNSGGNKSPKIDWTTPPEGTKSLVLTVYDQSNTTPHQIICNITPDVMGRLPDQKTMIPPGAQVSTGHSKAGNMWYGPGAGGAAHAYEIRVWALSTPMLEGGCSMSGAAPTRAVYMKLKTAPATLVLASDGKVLHGNVEGKCD